MMKRFDQYLLAGIVALTVVIHLTVVFVVLPRISAPLTPSFNQEGYPDGYDQLAANLAAGNGYRFFPQTARTTMREPGYPLMLAGIYLLFGNAFTAVKAANMVLAFATAFMMLPISKRLMSRARWHGVPVWILPSLLFLLHPGTLIAESRGGLEILFACLLVVFMNALYKALEERQWWWYAAAGVVLGITVLVRSTPMLFPFFVIGGLVLSGRARSWPDAACKGGLMVMMMFVVLSPWIVRNFRLTGKIVPSASVLGVSAQAGQYINEHLFEGRPWWLLDREAARMRDKLAIQEGYRFEEGANGYYQTFYRTGDEISFSKYLVGVVIRRYEKEPLLFVRCTAQNLVNFWVSGKTWTSTAIDAVIQIPYLIFAVVGAIYGIEQRKRMAIWPIVAFIAYMMMVHAPVLAQARYSIPLIPLVSILSAGGVVTVLKRGAVPRMVASPELASAGGVR